MGKTRNPEDQDPTPLPLLPAKATSRLQEKSQVFVQLSGIKITYKELAIDQGKQGTTPHTPQPLSQGPLALSNKELTWNQPEALASPPFTSPPLGSQCSLPPTAHPDSRSQQEERLWNRSASVPDLPQEASWRV